MGKRGVSQVSTWVAKRNLLRAGYQEPGEVVPSESRVGAGNQDMIVFSASVNISQNMTVRFGTVRIDPSEAWESFYNCDRPHISLAGKTPYEVMRST
jgi:hypothetical protein